MEATGSAAPDASNSAKSTSSLATVSLVLGIYSIACLGFITGIPAILLGHMALGRIKTQPDVSGRGLAAWGLGLGYAGSVLGLMFCAGGFLPHVFGNETKAISIAEEEWSKTWIKHDGRWHTKWSDRPMYLQLKDRRIEVDSKPLSESQKLNGYEWRGVVKFYSTAQRFYAPQATTSFRWSGQFKAGWNEWHTPKGMFGQTKPIQQVVLSKKNGKWQVMEVTPPITSGHWTDRGTKPTASEIPDF